MIVLLHFMSVFMVRKVTIIYINYLVQFELLENHMTVVNIWYFFDMCYRFVDDCGSSLS
jgi:hypothetical protein